MKKSWQFKAAGRDAITIQIFEEIGDSMFSEGTTAKSFSSDLEAAGPCITGIKLQISSAGGNVWDGLSIYELLCRHPADVTAEVFFAASIASVIAMAARKISIAPTGVMMLHEPYAATGGTAAEHLKMASALDRVRDAMVVAYRKHSKKTKAEIEKILSQETWYSAQEAVDAGFAEEISDPDEHGDGEMAAAFNPQILAKFRHVPRPIAARFAASPELSRGVPDEERSRLSHRLELLKRLPDENR